MSNLIPLSIPSIKGNEWKYVKECLDTEWVSSAGKYVDLFEQKIAEFTGAQFAIATVNAKTAGLAPTPIAILTASGTSKTVAPTFDMTRVKKVVSTATDNCITHIGASPTTTNTC